MDSLEKHGLHVVSATLTLSSVLALAIYIKRHDRLKKIMEEIAELGGRLGNGNHGGGKSWPVLVLAAQAMAATAFYVAHGVSTSLRFRRFSYWMEVSLYFNILAPFCVTFFCRALRRSLVC